MGDANALSDTYEDRRELLEDVGGRLEKITRAALGGLDHHHIDRISFRVKGTKSFLEKVTDRRTDPPYSDPLAEVEDQIAGRVIVFFRHDIEPVLTALGGAFNRVERSHHRPKADDAFGYESHHLILLIPPHLKDASWLARDHMPNTFELQVRTLFMHAYAEPQHDLGYKAESDLSSTEKRQLAWIAASSWGSDEALERLYVEVTARNKGADRTESSTDEVRED